MFYIKKYFEDDDTAVNIPLDDTTVYTNCPFCGSEVETDLIDVVTPEFDVYGSSILCTECNGLYKSIRKGEDYEEG